MLPFSGIAVAQILESRDVNERGWCEERWQSRAAWSEAAKTNKGFLEVDKRSSRQKKRPDQILLIYFSERARLSTGVTMPMQSERADGG